MKQCDAQGRIVVQVDFIAALQQFAGCARVVENHTSARTNLFF
jgi:hypothetical protein